MPDFLKDAFKAVSSIPLVGPFIAPAAGFALGGPLGAAAASGISTGFQTGNPLAGALAAGGSYLGGNIAGNVLGDKLGTIGSGITSAFGNDAGSFAGNILGPELSGASLSGALGSAIGSNLAQSFAGNNDIPSATSAGPGATPFQPKHEDNLSLPGSLSGLSGLSSDQIGSNIATKGVYGGGEGPEENSYFANLFNHKLISDSGQVSGDTSSISPIEGSYLNQLGLGGYSNPNDLLQSISKKRASGGAYGGFA